VNLVSSAPSRGRLLLLCLTSLFFAGAGYAPTDSAQEVTASRAGFDPAVIRAHKGEALHLRLRSRDQEHCFAVDALRVEKRIVADRVTTVDVTPDRVGTFPFYCCLETGAAREKETGRLVVAD
jgi:heme/copper-type cytochrome/quinol oxidase subunit 2